ncbi:MAG: hypothetical protein ACXWXV_11235 [Aeromicrobium sp.]
MDRITARADGAAIESPRHDGLSLQLVLRETPADDCAADFVGGLPWPHGTSVRLVDQRTSARADAWDAREISTALGRAGIRVVDEHLAGPTSGSGRRRSPDIVITGGSHSSGGLRRFVAHSLAEREVPMLVALRPQLTRGLIVIDDELSASLLTLLCRDPFRRARFLVLGIMNPTDPWDVGLSLLSAESVESETAKTIGSHLLLETATRSAAHSLSRAGIVASAQVEEGDAERTILHVAHDMAADWVVLARLIDGTDAVLPLVDRLVGKVSVLISPTVGSEGYPRHGQH